MFRLFVSMSNSTVHKQYAEFSYEIIDINYYCSSLTGFAGNALVVFMSLKILDKEINAYKCFTFSQAAIEAIDSLLTLLLKPVSAPSFLSIKPNFIDSKVKYHIGHSTRKFQQGY